MILKHQNDIQDHDKEINKIGELYKLEGIGSDKKNMIQDQDKDINQDEKDKQLPIIATAGLVQDMEKIGSTAM